MVAEVVAHRRYFVMLDVGLLVYHEGPTDPFEGAGWMAGSLMLGVDPFFYAGRHAKDASVPAAIHTWTITGIWREAAPFVPRPGNERELVRDPGLRGWLWLDRTDAGEDDGGHAWYLLRCRLEADEPVRHP